MEQLALITMKNTRQINDIIREEMTTGKVLSTTVMCDEKKLSMMDDEAGCYSRTELKRY